MRSQRNRGTRGNRLAALFRRFWGPIPWMIEVAALLSAVVGKWEEFGIILSMLLSNAGLDFSGSTTP